MSEVSPPIITKELLRELGDWRVDKEGRQLAETGRVTNLQYDPPILSGQVRTVDGATVAARLKVGKSALDTENRCSCRQARVDGIICAHVVALVYAWLNKDVKTVERPPVAPKPAEPSPPSFPRVTGSPMLELTVLLPVNFSQAWRSGAVQVILEASLNGGPSRQFHTIPQQPSVPYIVSEEDEELLKAVEQLNAGQVPAIWRLKDFDTFFSALASHPRVMLGKKSTLAVRASAERLKVFLDLQPNGELQLRAAAIPVGPGEMLGAWRFDGTTLERVSPGINNRTIPRTDVPRFYEQELPALEEQADVVGNAPFEQLEFSVVTPRIRVTVDGSLSAVSVKLEAVYPDHVFPITAAPPRDWLPDPNNPLRYWTRDATAERTAKQAVARAGFADTLRSEPLVGSFLANVLPRWRDQWEVVIGDQLQALLSKCEIITPELAIRPTGNDWLAVDMAFKNGRGESPLTPIEVRQLLQKGVAHQRLANGHIALVATEAMQEFQEVIFDCEARQTGAGMQIPQRFGAYLKEAARENNWQPPTALAQPRELVLPGNLAEPVASVPTCWRQLARSSQHERLGRHPGRRDGPGQNNPGPRMAGHAEVGKTFAGDLPDKSGDQLAGRGRKVHAGIENIAVTWPEPANAIC